MKNKNELIQSAHSFFSLQHENKSVKYYVSSFLILFTIGMLLSQKSNCITIYKLLYYNKLLLIQTVLVLWCEFKLLVLPIADMTLTQVLNLSFQVQNKKPLIKSGFTFHLFLFLIRANFYSSFLVKIHFFLIILVCLFIEFFIVIQDNFIYFIHFIDLFFEFLKA